jgi:hypothetical protein
MNPETKFSGHWIVADQGMGKTNLLLHMLASDLQEDASVIIMDAKGELTEAVRVLDIPGMRIIDPREPVAINPLDVSEEAIDQVLYIFAGLADASVTAKQEAFLRPLLRGMILAFPQPTLATLQRVINKKQDFQQYINNLPPYLQHFFDVEWAEYNATRSDLTWRLRLLLDNRLVRSMFSAPKTLFNIGREMNERGPIIINNAQALVGKKGATFIGRYFISEIWRGATARYQQPKHKWKPVFVYLDEADTVIDSTIAEIIDRCRGARIALILAHQRKGQIEDANVLSALQNCAIKMANVSAEASYFSKLLHVPEERMNQLPRGHFAMHVRQEGSSIAAIPKASLPFREMTEAQEMDLRERMRFLYAPKTHEPLKEGESRAIVSQPAEADKPVVRRTNSSPSPDSDDSDSSPVW